MLKGKALRRTLVHELIDCQVSNVLAFSRSAIARHQFTSAVAAQQVERTVTTGTKMTEEKRALETFLYHRVYRHEQVVAGRHQAQQQLLEAFDILTTSPERLPIKFQDRMQTTGIRRAAADYLAGMTDQFFSRQHQVLSQS